MDEIVRGNSVYATYGDREYYLYDADLSCKHSVRSKELWEGGGVECRKCKGWFCA